LDFKTPLDAIAYTARVQRLTQGVWMGDRAESRETPRRGKPLTAGGSVRVGFRQTLMALWNG